MDQQLRLHRGQQRLTLEQREEAKRFGALCLQQYLSTESVDEQKAEDCLWRAYEASGLTGPRHIHWLNGPLELIAILTRESDWLYVQDSVRDHIAHCIQDDVLRESGEISRLREGARETIDFHVRSVQQRVRESLPDIFGPFWGPGVAGGVWSSIGWPVRSRVINSLGEVLWRAIGNVIGQRFFYRMMDRTGSIAETAAWHSICAYDTADDLASMAFFDAYFAHNAASALAQFNPMVSGYWLGARVALLVRRPAALSFDSDGLLHSETGKCVEYPDGWGCYAWHGVLVDERVILAPETLTRDDFLHERNIEARRIIQERMGQRFVWELEGKFIDSGPDGVLYEVELPGDWEGVARYVQVQDASTPHQYYLRVPPNIQTVAEAVAWSFNMSVGEYHPAKET